MSTSRVFTVGQVLTAAQMNDLPQGILAKATSTTNVGPTTGGENEIITAPAATIAGSTRRLKIRFHCRNITGTVTGDVWIMRIKEGTTVLQEAHFFVASGGAAAGDTPDFFAIVDSPSAASHTYHVTIQQVAGTGTATLSGTAAAPITVTVEDVGQV